MSTAATQTQVKERPIIFGAESVRAILEGRKTQTRRVVKFPEHLRPEGTDWIKAAHEDGGGNWIFWSTDAPGYAEFTKQAYPNGEGIACPYGKPGERLWVREKWCDISGRGEGEELAVHYSECEGLEKEVFRWQSPIFMPRWASRITLEITGVRAERLQDISEEDARAEGALPEFEMNIADFVHNRAIPESTHVLGYKHRWNEINRERGFGWDTNPWVWAISFRPLN